MCPAGGQSSFDGNPNANPPVVNGYRPGNQDFDGAAFVNDTANPPDVATMPSAVRDNTVYWQLVSVGKAMDVGGFSATASGAGSISSYWQAANIPQTSPFSIARTGGGGANGDWAITWPAGTFPTSGSPKAWLNAVLGAHNYAIGAVYVTNGVRITTVIDGALADINFSVALF